MYETIIHKEDLNTVSVNDKENNIASKYTLSQNYPNPFNPTTTIEFTLSQANQVTLKIYNNLGMEIETLASDILPAGTHHYNWNATGLASGMYFYRIETEDYTEAKKMMLVR